MFLCVPFHTASTNCEIISQLLLLRCPCVGHFKINFEMLLSLTYSGDFYEFSPQVFTFLRALSAKLHENATLAPRSLPSSRYHSTFSIKPRSAQTSPWYSESLAQIELNVVLSRNGNLINWIN